MISSEKGYPNTVDSPLTERLSSLWLVADYDNLVGNYFAFKF
jgi:hypothetical protein